MGRCAAPCAGLQTPAEYAPAVHALADLVEGRDDASLHTVAAEIDALAARERFETAARRRDQLAALIVGLGRSQRLAALASLPELVGGGRSPSCGTGGSPPPGSPGGVSRRCP
jgi:DNA polymerase-3 subunit epsilon